MSERAKTRPTFDEIAAELAATDVGRLDLMEDRLRTRAVLHNVFPPRVAAALREGRPIEAENHLETTVFFSDIVGFTTLSEKLEPEQVLLLRLLPARWS